MTTPATAIAPMPTSGPKTRAALVDCAGGELVVPVAEWCSPVVATEDVPTEVPTGGTTVDGTPVETPVTPVEETPTEETGAMLEGSEPVGFPGTLVGGAGPLPEVVGIPGGGTTGGAVLQVSTVTVTVAVTVLHSWPSVATVAATSEATSTTSP